MKTILIALVLSLSGTIALAHDIAGPTFSGACLVFLPVKGSGPNFLVNKAIKLKEEQSEVIYKAGSLTYSVQYRVLAKGSPNDEIRELELTVVDSSRGLRTSASGEAGTTWKQSVDLQPPYGLPRFACNAL